MCGIAGFCNWGEGWQRNIERMNERMYYRGPDASGVWAAEDASVVLGHRRLSGTIRSSCELPVNSNVVIRYQRHHFFLDFRQRPVCVKI